MRLLASAKSAAGQQRITAAVPVLGARASMPWFIAHVSLLLMSGYIDYQLADHLSPAVPARTSAVFFSLNFAAISGMAFFLLRFAAMQKERYENQLNETHRLLQIEQDRSEKLLLNILPTPVAERLKMENQTIADGFADVTVMFADLVGFTELSSELPPQKVVDLLNGLFTRFDQAAQELGIEKIKTVGDAYMAVCGLPDPAPDHAERMVRMAIRMVHITQEHALDNLVSLQLRVGINSGPVVAGVIGKSKYIYDLWGDTVNVASRLSQRARAGEALFSRSVMDAVSRHCAGMDCVVVESREPDPQLMALVADIVGSGDPGRAARSAGTGPARRFRFGTPRPAGRRGSPTNLAGGGCARAGGPGDGRDAGVPRRGHQRAERTDLRQGHRGVEPAAAALLARLCRGARRLCQSHRPSWRRPRQLP